MWPNGSFWTSWRRAKTDMLEPDNRRLLMDILSPPAGYEFDRAVATTFTLDLSALLAIPLAFTFDRTEDEEGLLATDPLALLESARRHAERIAVFCHGGQISAPRPGQTALAFLENSVVNVFPPDERIKPATFHPKVWILRYVAAAGPIRYRLVCSSRNLTFDRSWDSALVLEGELTEGDNAVSHPNGPLVEFVAALPDLAVGPVPDFHRRSVEQFTFELPRVSFKAPPGLKLDRFLSFGLQPTNPDFPDREHRPLLAISPFVDGWFLGRLARRKGRTVLISRREELLRAIPEQLQKVDEVYEFRSSLDPEPEDLDLPLPPLSGLHSKVYVLDDGWNARICIGSANSSRAALGNPPRNVEFMVELAGRKGRYGIDALLGKDEESSGTARFRDLIAPFVSDGLALESPEVDDLEKVLNDAVESLARADLGASVEHSGEGEIAMRILVRLPPDRDPRINAVICWPIALRAQRAQPLVSGEVFKDLRLEELSGFLSIEISAREGRRTARRRFARPITVIGMPCDRLQRLIAGTLKNRQRLLQLLWLLLSPDGEINYVDFAKSGSAGETPAQAWGSELTGLLERTLETLATRPQRLDRVDRLLEELRSTESGADLVDEDFANAWESVMAVRNRRD